MTLEQHAAYLGCVVVAGYVQNLTGFAFGLILLGLVGLMDVAALPDVANVVGVLVLVNAIGMFRAARPELDRAVMRPVLWAGLPGILVGVLSLGWLSQNVVAWLKLLLGLTILACAGVLLAQSRVRAARSSDASFAVFGFVSGVMGGLFSTAGPPLVYHFYRQPMALRAIRDALVTIFAVNALVRLGFVAAAGQFRREALWLCLEAMPVVLLQAHLMARNPPKWRRETVKRIVSLLLGLVALALITRAGREAGLF
jgi:hypothetical protein